MKRETGPSPLARGSLAAGLDDRGEMGSIPAGAGEPSLHGGAGDRHAVHPRWRGGA